MYIGIVVIDVYHNFTIENYVVFYRAKTAKE